MKNRVYIKNLFRYGNFGDEYHYVGANDTTEIFIFRKCVFISTFLSIIVLNMFAMMLKTTSRIATQNNRLEIEESFIRTDVM